MERLGKRLVRTSRSCRATSEAGAVRNECIMIKEMLEKEHHYGATKYEEFVSIINSPIEEMPEETFQRVLQVLGKTRSLVVIH